MSGERIVRGNSGCKDFEVGMNLVGWWNNKEGCVVGIECVRCCGKSEMDETEVGFLGFGGSL